LIDKIVTVDDIEGL